MKAEIALRGRQRFGVGKGLALDPVERSGIGRQHFRDHVPYKDLLGRDCGEHSLARLSHNRSDFIPVHPESPFSLTVAQGGR